MRVFSAYLRGIYKVIFRSYDLDKIKNANDVKDFYSIYSFGELNPEKIYFHISDCSGPRSGLYSIASNIWREILLSDVMGWTPIIDETSNLLKRLKKEVGGGRNWLTEYFDFCNEISQNELYNLSNVIIDKSFKFDKWRLFLKTIGRENEFKKVNFQLNYSAFELSDSTREYMRNTIKKHWRYNDKTQAKLNECDRLMRDKGNILGVAVREGKMYINDYFHTKKSESIQPTIDEYIANAKTMKKTWDYDSIYLSCETNETIQQFYDAFPEMEIIVLDRVRMPIAYYKEYSNIKKARKGLANERKMREDIDLEYIEDVYLLTKVDYMICAENGGAIAAYLMNPKMRRSNLLVLGQSSHYYDKKD